jgi:hypothetical protein
MGSPAIWPQKGLGLAGLGQPAVTLSPDGSHIVYVADRAGVQ